MTVPDKATVLATPSFRTVGPAGLPIFRFDAPDAAIFYVPGVHPATVTPPGMADALERALADPHAVNGRANGRIDRAAPVLVDHARDVTARTRERLERAFEPECLTLLMTNACNMGCHYCHTSAGSMPARSIALSAVLQAAEAVAENCVRKSVPFTTVFHGGGEPTLYPELLEAALDIVDRAVSRHHLESFTYIATNGLMSEETARRIARRFDLVGFSCDGPEDLQLRHRPALNGKSSSRIVERNARILREEGCNVSVRATVTDCSVTRLVEAVEYFRDRFEPQRIVFEPLYARGFAIAGPLRPPDPDEFVWNLLLARRRAADYGVPVEFPDSRPEELHGPFCHIYRDVLSVTPDGRITGCFDATESRDVESERYFIGSWDASAGRLAVDADRLRTFRAGLAMHDPVCASCFNRFHCAQGCPEICPLRGPARPSETSRCRMALLWTYYRIREECGLSIDPDAHT